MTEIKICGLSDEDCLHVAIAEGARYVGFVFFPPSPRAVTPAAAARLLRRIGPDVRARTGVVALLVDADDGLIAEVTQAIAPDLLQLHGKESPERVTSIGQHFAGEVMKAIAVRDGDDVDKGIARYGASADWLLFDAKPPPGATRPGGHGVVIDWSLLSADRVGSISRWMLGGGLTPDNVGAAIAATEAPVLDVSSGVECAPGVKDAELIRKFLRAGAMGQVRR